MWRCCHGPHALPLWLWLFSRVPVRALRPQRLQDCCAHRSKSHSNCCYQPRLHQLRLPTGCEHCIQLGGCQQRVQFVKQKSCNTQLARTTNKTARRQWAAEATSSASPAARTACSVRAAASHPTLSMASTLADDARPPRRRRDPGKRVASMAYKCPRLDRWVEACSLTHRRD